MKNVKIGTKLVLSFLFIAALTAFMGIYLIRSLEALDEEIDILYDKGAVPLGLLVKTAGQVQELRLDIRRWQLAKTDEGRAAQIKAMEETYNTIKELISKQKELILIEAGKKILDDLREAVDKYVVEVHNYAKNVKIDPATGLSMGDLSPAVFNTANEMSKALDDAVERRIKSTKGLSDNATNLTSHSEKIAVMLLIAVLLISISFGLFLTYSITRPLYTVVNALSKIEKGNMTVRTGLNREDELGILSKALDSLSVKLQTIFRNLRLNSDTLAGSSEELSNISKQLASGSEEVSAKTMSVSSAIEQVSVNIKSIASIAEESATNVMDVTSSVEQVAGNINAMASGAEEASVNTTEIAGTAKQMSANMNTIAAAIEEMSSSISQISNNAGDARKIANEATVKSNDATQAMNKLGIAAKEIGHVTDVIKKIADKTNLLALNATIEAASAGAAGRGFAVVAGEIKELANQSAKSADDIAQRVQGIQTGTSEAVTVISSVSEIIAKIYQSVEAISSHVEQQTKASNEIANNVAQANVGVKRVAESMSEVAKSSKNMAHNASQANTGAKHVAESMNEVAKSSKDIARNAGEAAKGASEVSQNVLGVNQVARESAQGASQINQGASELARLASDLKSVLSKFEI